MNAALYKFDVLAGRFPGDGGVVAPGMSCKYTVRFAPDSLADYEDFIIVETQAEHLLVVPVAAARPPPILTCESHDSMLSLTCCSAHQCTLLDHALLICFSLIPVQYLESWTVVTV